MPQLELLELLILLMQMEKLLRLKQIFHYADAVHQRKSHFAMVVTAMLGLLASNYLAA